MGNEMNTRKKGAEYEQTAIEYLQRQGVEILEHNYRNRRGEIDIIGKDGDYTVFIEVKYRKDSAAGQPAEAVVEKIISEQRIDVDAVTGATNSSTVLKKAVENALKDN